MKFTKIARLPWGSRGVLPGWGPMGSTGLDPGHLLRPAQLLLPPLPPHKVPQLRCHGNLHIYLSRHLLECPEILYSVIALMSRLVFQGEPSC